MTTSTTDTSARRILFVGGGLDAAELVRGLTDGARSGWTLERASSCAEALLVLENGSPQVVVVSAKSNPPEALELLDALMVHQPQITRFLVSDANSMESMLQCAGKVHHFIQEPCDWLTLLQLLARIDSARWGVFSPGLPALMSKLTKLPSPPEIYLQVVKECQANEISLERVGELIAQDPPLAAKVLQLANSAVLGLQMEVTHPFEAVNFLGLDTTQALLLLAHTFSMFEDVPACGFNLQTLQSHALNVGRFAQSISEQETANSEAHKEAFTGGLLHDIGKLLLAANLPQEYSWALKQSRVQHRHIAELESELLGASHAEVGGFLLDTWHLPTPIVNAVTWHHRPSRCLAGPTTFSALSAVHMANAAEHQLRPDPAGQSVTSVDFEYLNQIGCSNRFADWFKAFKTERR